MKLAIIGAGTGGLCAARHALQNNIETTIFEQNDVIGGTWVYVDETGTNRYGIDVHSSMYQGLRTNLPKEIMGFPDFPILEPHESYVRSEEILKHLNKYADQFKIRQHIRFLHYVIRITPKRGKWQIIVKDLGNDNINEEYFDYVMVCNGHYHTAQQPSMKGLELFQGLVMHSHDFRNAEKFKDETVLVIGAGPSGMDLCNEISKFASRVTLSHHLAERPKTKFLPNVNQSPDVESFDQNGVHFTDGSYQTFTVILLCTGYSYSFPFLSTDCGIHVDDNFVQPLYKHCININNPTMSFIGLPFYVCAAQMMDLQVRFVMQYMMGNERLPTKIEMLEDTNRQMDERWRRGYKKRQAHMMGVEQNLYYDDLAETANIDGIKPVMSKLHNESSELFLDDLLNYREDIYRIIDNETFIKLN